MFICGVCKRSSSRVNRVNHLQRRHRPSVSINCRTFVNVLPSQSNSFMRRTRCKNWAYQAGSRYQPNTPRNLRNTRRMKPGLWRRNQINNPRPTCRRFVPGRPFVNGYSRWRNNLIIFYIFQCMILIKNVS